VINQSRKEIAMMNPYVMNEIARLHREELLKASGDAKRADLAQKSQTMPVSRWLAIAVSFGTILVIAAIRLIGQ
jgi:hypothetical protein